MTELQDQPAQIFISHATEADGALAHQLATDLQEEGFKVWLAPDSILPGESWVEAIGRGLETSQFFVILMSNQAVNSQWVLLETSSAIELERSGQMQIIPLQLEICEIPTLWRAYQFIPFQIYQVGWKVLLRRLQSSSSALSHTPFTVEVSLLTKLYAPGGVSALTYLPTDYLIAGSRTGNIHRWELPKGREIAPVLAHEEPITDIAVSPKGDLIATASQDDTIKLWAFPSLDAISTLSGHSGTVYAVGFSHEGNYLVSGSRDTTVRVWNIPRGECLHILEKHTKSVYGVAFSPTSDLIVSASSDNSVILWSGQDEFEGNALGKPGDTTLLRTVFSPDGLLLAVGTWSGVIRLWDVREGKGAGILEGHRDRVYGLGFSPNGSILASGSKDGHLRLWKMPGKDLAYPPIEAHAGWIRALAFSPAGDTLATGDSDGVIALWKVETNEA